MRMSKMVGRRLREVPKDAKTVSHQFLIRGGYIRPVSTGIYSLLPVGERIVAKIQEIIRDEMQVPAHLLEHLASRILNNITDHFPRIEYAELTVTKYNPPLDGKVESTSVTVVYE